MPSSSGDWSRGGAREFASTHWSMVLSAKGGSTGATDALEKLCRIYWYPLYAYVRRQGMSPQDAQDRTQEFFAQLLEKGWLEGVERERGRFRSWLLVTMKHFLANARDRSRARKRGGGMSLLSLDAMSAEKLYLQEEPHHETAENLFDRRWALALLDQVLARLRAEMKQNGKLAQFESLKFSLMGEKSAYAEVARELKMTEGAVKVAVHRLRERYRALLRAEIAQTVESPAQIEEELRDLFAALSKP